MEAVSGMSDDKLAIVFLHWHANIGFSNMLDVLIGMGQLDKHPVIAADSNCGSRQCAHVFHEFSLLLIACSIAFSSR